MSYIESSRKELHEIHDSVQGLADEVDIFQNGRKFILQGQIDRVMKGSRKPYQLYLFNDVIVYTEIQTIAKKGTSKRYVHHKCLKDCLFIDCNTDTKARYLFELMHTDDRKKFTFAAKTFEEKITWKHSIEQQIVKLQEADESFDGFLGYGTPSSSMNSNSSSFLSAGNRLKDGYQSDESSGVSSIGDSPNFATLSQVRDGETSSWSEEEFSDAEGDFIDNDLKEPRHMLSMENGIVVMKAAPVSSIVWHLLYGDMSDTSLIHTFLLNFTAFCNAKVLFTNLLEVYDLLIPIPKFMSLKFSLVDTRKRIAAFLKFWLEQFFQRDFAKNKQLFDLVLNYLDMLDKDDQRLESNVIKLTLIKLHSKKLQRMGIGRKKHPTIPNHVSSANMSTSPTTTSFISRSSTFSPKDSTRGMAELHVPHFVDIATTQMAEQLSLSEHVLFQKVKLTEFAKLNWRNGKKHAPNILALIDRFNTISQWVATEIVMAQTPKIRTNTIEKFISLAQKCGDLKNYNTLMIVLAGLNRGSVQRLKKTWATISQPARDGFTALNQLMDPKANFRNYRDALKRGTGSCFPYFGIYLKDLTALEEGNPDKMNDLVNFEKIQMLSKIYKEVQFFQHAKYPFAEDEAMQNFFKRMLAIPEEVLYKNSQEIEPSSNSRASVNNA